MDRHRALMASVKEVPPVYISAYAIALTLGSLNAPEAEAVPVDPATGGQKGDAFFMTFGTSGSL